MNRYASTVPNEMTAGIVEDGHGRGTDRPVSGQPVRGVVVAAGDVRFFYGVFRFVRVGL